MNLTPYHAKHSRMRSPSEAPTARTLNGHFAISVYGIMSTEDFTDGQQ